MQNCNYLFPLIFPLLTKKRFVVSFTKLKVSSELVSRHWVGVRPKRK
jgi:hypothetical protein